MKKLHPFKTAAVIAIFFIPINILSQNCNYNWSLQGSGTANALYAGIYFYTLRSGSFSETRKMMLVK